MLKSSIFSVVLLTVVIILYMRSPDIQKVKIILASRQAIFADPS